MCSFAFCDITSFYRDGVCVRVDGWPVHVSVYCRRADTQQISSKIIKYERALSMGLSTSNISWRYWVSRYVVYILPSKNKLNVIAAKMVANVGDKLNNSIFFYLSAIAYIKKLIKYPRMSFGFGLDVDAALDCLLLLLYQRRPYTTHTHTPIHFAIRWIEIKWDFGWNLNRFIWAENWIAQHS